jgi:diphosphomevalonate decarboxylase
VIIIYIMSDDIVVTCSAPINMAVVKYWGKDNEDLIIPCNNSISATLDWKRMHSKTTIMASKQFTEDKFWLNNKEVALNTRLQRCIAAARQRAQQDHPDKDMSGYKLHIVSKNNFPTAAGLASSASGLACLAFTLGQVYNLQGDISTLARVGSGSACRSMYGGFVEWEKGGQAADGSDSRAVQLHDAAHWSELVVFVLVVNGEKKDVSSTDGMRRTVKESKRFQARLQHLPQTLATMREAIKTKDFDLFARTTMTDSDDFHACCEEVQVNYLSQNSRAIIRAVQHYNQGSKPLKVAYTFDAGPNAVLFTTQQHAHDVLAYMTTHFPPAEGQSLHEFILDSDLKWREQIVENGKSSTAFTETHAGAVKYVIPTSVGEGPQVNSPSEGLIDTKTGLPL